jgi:hypothetical protein
MTDNECNKPIYEREFYADLTDDARLEKIKELLSDGTVQRFPDYAGHQMFLLQQLEQRDKTIAEKEESRQSWRVVAQFRDERIQELTQQNTLMLSALERINALPITEYNVKHLSQMIHTIRPIARDTVAQVKGGE